MAAFPAITSLARRALEATPLTPPVSDPDSLTRSGQCIKRGEAQAVDDAAVRRKGSLTSSSANLPGYNQNKHERLTDDRTKNHSPSTAGTSSDGRPPFTLFKTHPKTLPSARVQTATTDEIRRRRLDRSSTCFPQFSADRIKETHPRRIAELWRMVMAQKTPSYSRPTKSSQSKVTEKTPTSSAAKTAGTKNATVRDVDFEETQLAPRGIEIQREGIRNSGALAGAHGYFDSSKPPDDGSRNFYRDIVQKSLIGRVERDINDAIFLRMDPDSVKSVLVAFRSLVEAGLPEAEFKTYACQNLFIGQYVLLADDVTRQLCAIRSIEWSVKPQEDFRSWHAPPLLSSSPPPSKSFNFDIHPDCQFWLCNKILNAEYRESIMHVVHCKAWGTFCPYLSIEFKATTDDRRIVVNQLAVAGSISLFNRFMLRLDAYGRNISQSTNNLIRHYGVTMEKETWKVWFFEPKMMSGKWNGCKMAPLDIGDCKTEVGVRRLLSWINELHRWGLCEYALECEDDIKCILKRGNLRVSLPGS